jgi:hypothetical protein
MVRWSACAVPLLLAGACAPPPLDGDGSGTPSVRFIFPTSDLAGPVCPDFFVAVDIDNFALVEPDANSGPIDGQGHWHLDDEITGDYYPLVEPYSRVEADLAGDTTRAYRMTATLVNVDHSALSGDQAGTETATVEFDVSSEDGCLGEASSDLTPP